MNFLDCIDNAQKDGQLSKEQADKAREMFIDFQVHNEANLQMPKIQAEAKASQDTFDVIKYEASERKRRMILQRATQRRALNDIASYKGIDKGEALIAFLERDGKGQSPYSNVVGRQAALRGMAHGMMDNILADLRKTQVLGRTTRTARAKSTSMVREIFGENTGDQAAKELAQAWQKASEFLRLSFNKAGGDIPKRKDWGMPQVHDNTAIRKAGRETWKQYIRPLLDAENMTSFRTGKPMTTLEFEDMLDEVWETIATDGFSKIKETSTAGQGNSLARRRQDHRFLKFKDADSWLKYQEEFGGGDVFSMMMSHIDTMSRDVALLEILGPNPNSTIKFLKTQVTKQAKEIDAQRGNDKMSKKIGRSIYRFDVMFDYITGASHAPVHEGVARTFAGLRNLLTSAYLGSTSLLAIMTDPNFTRIAKRMAGMPVLKSSMAKSLGMMTSRKMTKQQAIRLGLIAENWSSVAYGQSRYAGEIMGGRVSEAISNAALNISLLSPFTQAGRWAFGMEFMGFIADNAKKSWSELPQEFQSTMTKYGITRDAWSKLADVEPYEYQGATFLRPDDVMELDRDLAFKMLEMVQGMTNMAVPTGSVRTRTTLVGNTRSGTLIGEMARSTAMFKNFPVTFFQNNIQAILFRNNKKRMASLAADLLITSTATAALAIQLREIAKGRDPLSMDTPEFWGSALLTSGGLGIFGDLLFANVNRFGGGLSETAAGPVVSFFSDLKNLTVGNVYEFIQGEDTNIGRESIQFFGRNMPGASTWYLRLAIERTIMDQLLLATDPKATKRFRTLERGRIRDYDQEYWWRPGQVTPDRPPNIMGVMGE